MEECEVPERVLEWVKKALRRPCGAEALRILTLRLEQDSYKGVDSVQRLDLLGGEILAGSNDAGRNQS